MLLFNPGPTNVSEEVRKSIMTEDICHRESEFSDVLLRVNSNLIKLLNGEGTHSAVLFGASGTGSNEAIISSIHGKVLLINNGKYSERLGHIIDRYRIPLKRSTFNPTEEFDLESIEEILKEDSEITHVAMVHHETTTGMVAPLEEMGMLAKKYNVLLMVDAISSLGGHPLDLKKDNIAFCTVSANKCLQSFPGISFVIARDGELAKLKGQSRSFYFDLYQQWSKTQKGETPFTPPVQLVYALDKAINELLQEGYTKRVHRYRQLSQRMRQGIEQMGFKTLTLPEVCQSNFLTSIKMPKNMDYWQLHDRLKEKGIVIYSGQETLNQGIFRVATLGNIQEAEIDRFLQTFEQILKDIQCWPVKYL